MVLASSVEIREVDGLGRMITLRGRALPYQNVAWSEETRIKTDWYAGNPVGTIQVLGPQFDPTKMEGMWKDRFLPGQVLFEGFESTGAVSGGDISSEQLVDAFRKLQRAGASLRVQWGPNQRFGVLKRFEHNWIRLQDVKWSLEFEWSGDQEVVPRAFEVSTPNSDLRAAVTAQDDTVVFEPPYILPDYSDQLLARISDIREKVGIVFDRVRLVQSLVTLPINAVQGALAAVESIRAETEEELQHLVDVPYTVAQTSDRVQDVFALEAWRRTVASDARRVRAVSQKQGIALAKAAEPGILTIITVPSETSLRQLSTTYYGTPDSWQLIADVNGLVDSLVPAGTIIVVPPPNAAG